MEINWSRRAIQDLAEIEGYIARERPQTARQVAEHILASVEDLANFPELGKPGRRPGVRNLVVPPYVIAYRLRTGGLEILSDWHGRRSAPP